MNPKKLIALALLTVLIASSLIISGCIEDEVDSIDVSTITNDAIIRKTQIIEDITPEEAYDLIWNNSGNDNFVIIDVRTPGEYADGYIKDAVNIDYYSKTFIDDIDKLDKNRTYLIYCRSGGRSGGALDTMEELGFREVYNMLGGITQWESEGFSTVR